MFQDVSLGIADVVPWFSSLGKSTARLLVLASSSRAINLRQSLILGYTSHITSPL